MLVLGVKYWQHDTGAAVIYEREGHLQIVAICEARLNRYKNSHRFPFLAIQYCLDAVGATMKDVDVLALESFTFKWPTLQKTQVPVVINGGNTLFDADHRHSILAEQSFLLRHPRVHVVPHVFAHGASAFFMSPFERAAVLSIDAATNIFAGNGTTLSLIDGFGYDGPLYRGGNVVNYDFNDRQFPSGDWLYNFVTQKLGFSKFGAGKTMALASFAHQFERRNYLDINPGRFFDFLISHSSALARLGQITPFDLKQDPRGIEGLVSERWVNIAREAQEALEEDMLHLTDLARMRAGTKDLCIAGGVGLSCVINRKIIDRGRGGLFVQPAASDEGIALGVGLAGYYAHGGKLRTAMQNAYLGHANRTDRLKPLLDGIGLSYRPGTHAYVARLLADGKIGGRCHGASEYGPRALGNRSILADPRRADFVRRLNSEIKHREGFRPFAPSVHADKAHLYFDLPVEGPFMIVAAQVLPEFKSKLPAITHVDGSSRPQTVRRDQNPDYYDLIQAFGDLTGVYVLVNTSFNNDGEPIVETYEDAVISFCLTNLDFLVIDGVLIEPPHDRKALADRLMRARAESIEARYEELTARYCDFDIWSQIHETILGDARNHDTENLRH